MGEKEKEGAKEKYDSKVITRKGRERERGGRTKVRGKAKMAWMLQKHRIEKDRPWGEGANENRGETSETRARHGKEDADKWKTKKQIS